MTGKWPGIIFVDENGHLWFSPFSPLFWLFLSLRLKWWIHVSPMVIDRRKKSALLLWNIAKHSVETSSRCCFCSIVSKHGTHLAYSFLMSNFSVNIRCTGLFEIPTMSASPRTFSRQSSHTILWIFFTICVMVTSFGRPLRCSSWQLVRPRLNSATQYFIVLNEEADYPRVESSSTLILVRLRLFKWIVYYVPRRIMRVNTRRATVLAEDRSQDEAEARSVLRAF